MYRKAQLHFKKADPALYKAARDFIIDDIVVSNDVFEDVIWTIIGQQLSGKAATTIFERFKKIALEKGNREGGYDKDKNAAALTPQKILAVTDADMRACGISGSKARTIKNVAEKIKQKELDLVAIATLPDHEVVAELTKIKGIGPWTAEMLLMFSLGRTDVFSPGDLGLKKGAMALYNLKKLPDEKKLLALSKRWSPYRTYAARILYRVADKKKLKK
jgi:DNA-3-methyladenine glycosylase II